MRNPSTYLWPCVWAIQSNRSELMLFVRTEIYSLQQFETDCTDQLSAFGRQPLDTFLSVSWRMSPSSLPFLPHRQKTFLTPPPPNPKHTHTPPLLLQVRFNCGGGVWVYVCMFGNPTPHLKTHSGLNGGPGALWVMIVNMWRPAEPSCQPIRDRLCLSVDKH